MKEGKGAFPGKSENGELAGQGPLECSFLPGTLLVSAASWSFQRTVVALQVLFFVTGNCCTTTLTSSVPAPHPGHRFLRGLLAGAISNQDSQQRSGLHGPAIVKTVGLPLLD